MRTFFPGSYYNVYQPPWVWRNANVYIADFPLRPYSFNTFNRPALATRC